MKINKIMVLPLAVAIMAFGSIGSAGAQVAAPKVALQFSTSGLTSPLTASTTNATVARLLLDTTGSTEAVRISSLPFNLIVGGGGIASTLYNCRVSNENNISATLNANDITTFTSGLNSIGFDTPLVLNANTMTVLALRCDIGPDLVSGSTYTVNMNTANVAATGATTGFPAAVTIRGAAVIPPVVIPPVTPGIPATGVGGEFTQNILMVLASLTMAGLGFSLLNIKKETQPAADDIA